MKQLDRMCRLRERILELHERAQARFTQSERATSFEERDRHLVASYRLWLKKRAAQQKWAANKRREARAAV